MTHEERKKLYDDFHSGVRMMLDRIEKIARSEDAMTLEELGELADMMKDMSYVEKNIAKAHHCYSEKSDKVY